MTIVRVNLASQPYDICVGQGILSRLDALVESLQLGRRVGVVTHPALCETHRYAASIVGSLSRVGHEVIVATVPPGEESKSLAQAERLWRELARGGLDRASTIIALGGGVVGDLAGFVAATLFRGIRFVTAPTTLLAQVDSSVGGKTGLNLPEGKNLVGAFHQPSLVVADVLTLKTLAEREFRSGLAEVVKHAMIADVALFEVLEREAERVLRRDADVLEAIIAKNCAIKARVVEQDEREAGLRAVLNFGHTVGHAIEAALGYGVVTHGEAVAYGMLAAAALSVRRGLCAGADAQRLEALLRRFDLIPATRLSPKLLETYILRDKKMRDGVLQFVLTLGVGSVTLAPISDRTDLWEALHGLQA
jgi:3-dehydroquinate synthase